MTSDVIDLLRDRSFAHLAFVDDEGWPHVTPLWVDVTDDGHVLLNTAEGRVKERALQQGTRVAMSVGLPDRPYSYVMIRGTVASRSTDGAEADIHRLSQKYVGKDYSMAPGMVRITVLVAPEHIHVH